MSRWIHAVMVAPIALTSCAVWGTGIAPISPEAAKTVPAPRVDSVQPTLVWDGTTFDDRPDVSDVVYDVFVYDVDDSFPPQPIIVYHASDLTESEHTLESPLAPNKRYWWRVRARYKESGEDVVGDWNGFSYVGILPPWFGWGTLHYFFETPPVPAGAARG